MQKERKPLRQDIKKAALQHHFNIVVVKVRKDWFTFGCSSYHTCEKRMHVVVPSGEPIESYEDEQLMEDEEPMEWNEDVMAPLYKEGICMHSMQNSKGRGACPNGKTLPRKPSTRKPTSRDS